ncbi:MAG: acetyltransferase [Bacteroidetes bacterium]|nr:acetyltransferase [Bacteroidota bacterium]
MLIVGTGGLGKEVMQILLTEKQTDSFYFFDENPQCPSMLYDRFRVIKEFDELKEYFDTVDKKFVTAIGHPRIREKVTAKILAAGGIPGNVISCNTYIFPFNEIPEGIIVQPGVGISHGVKFGRFCAIHINSSIGHSSFLGNYINVAPSVNIIGPVKIGDYSYISAGAVIMPHLEIGKNVIVEPGVVVKRDLKDFETYSG